jgi:hypothetical protein
MNTEKNLNGNNQEVIKTNEIVQKKVPVEVESEETKQAKVEKQKQKDIENNKKIEEIKGEISKQFENNEYGEATIKNPKILDMIAEIEYCHIEDMEIKEQMIQNWKKMVEKQYQESLEYFNEDPEDSTGTIYGNGGKDRYLIMKGNVFLQHDPDSNLIASSSARKRAKELGMGIIKALDF